MPPSVLPEGLEHRFVAALNSVVGDKKLELHEPWFEGNEKKYVKECIDSGYVSSVGEFVSLFEKELARFTGAPFAIAVVNGTSALHLALVSLGVKPGDEVLVPALSFVATAAAVVLAGAVPHFVDVSQETWGVSATALRGYISKVAKETSGKIVNRQTGRPITALVAMHTLGFPSDGHGLAAVAEEFGLLLVEDAAESLGSLVGTVHTGLFGQAGVFSFNGNKTVTTGGGGAIITRDPDLAYRLKHLSTTAKIPHPFEFDHDEVGYNYRMPNINAAIGVAQLEQLPKVLRLQRKLHGMYDQALTDLGLGLKPSERPGTTSNYWLQAFILKTNLACAKDKIIKVCIDEKITVRPLWKPLNRLSPYQAFPAAVTPVAEDLYSRVICLPSSPVLAK